MLPDARAVVAVLVYRGVTTGEVDAPSTTLADRLHADVRLVGPSPGPLPGVEPSRRVIADVGPADAPVPDVLVVPGGLGWRQVVDDDELTDWLVRAATGARGTLAISTGSLLLAAVGRLAGRDAAGHWLALRELAELGANPQPGRTAHADGGQLVTASGPFAALQVVDELAGLVEWSR